MNKAVIYISGTTNETVNNMIAEVLERYCEKHEYEIVALLGENYQAGMSMPMKYSFIGMAEVEDIDAVVTLSSEELKSALLDIARNMALAQLQEFELKTDGGNCPDNLEREIESLKKSKAHYAKLKFEIYDDYTKANITRDQMAKKTAEVKQKIAEIESLITEKQETLDMQKDLFLDAKQEQLTKLSKLDEFDEEVIRYLIDYVLVYDNEHIEIRWNFDDFQAG